MSFWITHRTTSLPALHWLCRVMPRCLPMTLESPLGLAPACPPSLTSRAALSPYARLVQTSVTPPAACSLHEFPLPPGRCHSGQLLTLRALGEVVPPFKRGPFLWSRKSISLSAPLPSSPPCELFYCSSRTPLTRTFCGDECGRHPHCPIWQSLST